MTPLEIKGAIAAVFISALILVATFTAGGIYRSGDSQMMKGQGHHISFGSCSLYC
jgi:hypothetical protein